MSENGEIYTAGKNFTLPLALTAWTYSTSVKGSHIRSSILSECKTIIVIMQLVSNIDSTIHVITFN